MKIRFMLLSLLSFAGIAGGTPREWTDQSGRKISAEYVSSDGGQVMLSINGKDYKMPVTKLSEADQAYLKTLETHPDAAAPDPAVKVKIGKQQKVEITKKAFADWTGYYSGRFGKQLKRFYEKSKGIVDDADRDTMTTVESAVMWEKTPDTGTMIVYVPPGYDGTAAYGVLVYVSPGDRGVGLVRGWSELFDEKKLIYCSPAGTGNRQADMRRIALALDSVATIRAGYKVDPARLFVSGTSGGGAIATTIAVNFAEFRAIDCSRGSAPEHPSCFPYLDKGDFRAIARGKQRYAWVSGLKDSNYKYITTGVAAWKAAGVEARLFEHPDQGHAAGTADLMRQALTWLEEKPEGKQAE